MTNKKVSSQLTTWRSFFRCPVFRKSPEFGNKTRERGRKRHHTRASRNFRACATEVLEFLQLAAFQSFLPRSAPFGGPSTSDLWASLLFSFPSPFPSYVSPKTSGTDRRNAMSAGTVAHGTARRWGSSESGATVTPETNIFFFNHYYCYCYNTINRLAVKAKHIFGGYNEKNSGVLHKGNRASSHSNGISPVPYCLVILIILLSGF